MFLFYSYFLCLFSVYLETLISHGYIFYLEMLDTQRILQLANLFRLCVGVSEDLRGYNWQKPPVEPPVNGVELSVSEITSRYCESMRDVYLRHVEGVSVKPTPRMVEGRVYHDVIHRVVEEVKRVVYGDGVLEGSSIFERVVSRARGIVERIAFDNFRSVGVTIDGGEFLGVVRRALALWRFLALSLSSSIDLERSSFGSGSVDSVVARAIPQVAEYRVDGSRIGLSRMLSVDVFMPGYAVVDYKTGSKREFHRLALAGYALALESELGVNVDMGAIIYISFDGDSLPRVSVDYHEIGDEARMEFLELRDEALSIVEHGRDPGFPPRCYRYCPFREVCGR